MNSETEVTNDEQEAIQVPNKIDEKWAEAIFEYTKSSALTSKGISEANATKKIIFNTSI